MQREECAGCTLLQTPIPCLLTPLFANTEPSDLYVSMAAFCAGFALRGGVPSIASNDNNRRLAARCVLDEAPDTSAATKANVKARYRRLGAGEGLDLPSPPRHYSVPRLGLVVENVLRLSTPVELFERYGSVFASNYDTPSWIRCWWVTFKRFLP